MQMVERRESITTSCQNVRGCEWRVKEDKLLRLSALGPTLPPVGRNCNTLQVVRRSTGRIPKHLNQ